MSFYCDILVCRSIRVHVVYITLDGNFSNGPSVLRLGKVPLAVSGIESVQPNPVNSSTRPVVASTE